MRSWNGRLIILLLLVNDDVVILRHQLPRLEEHLQLCVAADFVNSVGSFHQEKQLGFRQVGDLVGSLEEDREEGGFHRLHLSRQQFYCRSHGDEEAYSFFLRTEWVFFIL